MKLHSVLLLIIVFSFHCSQKNSKSNNQQPVTAPKSAYELFDYLQESILLIQKAAPNEIIPDSRTFEAQIINKSLHLSKYINTKTTNPSLVDSLINTIYNSWNITFDPDQDTIDNTLPNIVFKRKKGSCLGVSLLFLLLAERIPYPLYGVYVPSHFFIRYDDGSVKRNIEPNRSGYSHPDEYYRKKYLPDETISYALRNLSKMETAAILFYNLGNICLNNGKSHEAISCFQKSCALMPEFAQSWGNLGITFAALSMDDSAAAAFNAAYRLNPRLLRLLENIGSFELSRHNAKRAVAAYREGLTYFPGDANLLYGMAYTYVTMNRLDSARLFAQKISGTDSTGRVRQLIKLIREKAR